MSVTALETENELAAPPLLQAVNVRKAFGATLALSNASMALRTGEIHALLGANGAGKSTLAKVIAGHHRADAGDISYRDAPIDFRSTREAMQAGISIVMQETSLAPDMTVLENIFLPELGTPGRLSYRKLRDRAVTLLDELDASAALPLDREVASLSAAQRQLVEITKALASDAELIIFDEPTTSLSPGEVEHLFDIMARLRAGGRALIFVSHRLEEVFAISDTVTVLREGATVAAGVPTSELSQNELIRLMVGRELGEIYSSQTKRVEPGDAPVVFQVEHLAALPMVRDVSFRVHAGEILGLGGLVGAGRSETAEAIFGLRSRSAGTIMLGGKQLNIRSPSQAMRAGIGFVPEDRRVQNIIPDLNVRENVLLAHLGARRGVGLGYRVRRRRIEELFGQLDLPIQRLDDPSMLDFSGGQQQKLIIARWLLLAPRVLILDEPTKGVDIGTRQAIYRILRCIADEGVGVVVISSDFNELLGASDRIAVISDGMSIANVSSDELDEEQLTLLAAPRTSMTRNTELLHSIATETGGSAFWVLLHEERLICLNVAVAGEHTEPGFGAGDSLAIVNSRIPHALGLHGAAGSPEFVEEPCGELATLTVTVHNRRGHDMGCIGLIVNPPESGTSATDIRRRIEELYA